MKCNRIMIAAPKSGSGKTIMTCALLQALKSRGVSPVSFKCGPDYIDPMFHEKVIGVPSKNLDTFFTDERQTRKLFLNGLSENSFAVLEGVMGLFDGLGGTGEEGSSYHLAQVTKTPVILAADVRGMGRSVIPMLAGFLAYDSAHLIKGVILNRISKAYYERLKPLIEKELGISVFGFLPQKEELCVESRYLGLKLPEERNGIKQTLRAVSEQFCQTVSIAEIIKTAESAEELNAAEADVQNVEEKRPAAACAENEQPQLLPDMQASGGNGPVVAAGKGGDGPVIAAAKDEAFCFYYADNLQLLRENGARIIYFSPLHDKKLPDGCHALLIGGGYPELYAGQLSANAGMRASVKNAVENGMPLVAECGGFLYLHSAVKNKDGITYPMAGVLPGTCFDTGALVRFGYVEIREKQSRFLPDGESIKGHEFHYYDSTDNGHDALARKPATGRTYPCVMEGENYWMGFPHLYFPSNPAFAERFVKKAEKYSVKGRSRRDAGERNHHCAGIAHMLQ